MSVVVTGELWPQGDPREKSVLGVAQIALIGASSDGHEVQELEVTLSKFDGRSRWRHGVIKRFPIRGPWDLLYRMRLFNF